MKDNALLKLVLLKKHIKTVEVVVGLTAEMCACFLCSCKVNNLVAAGAKISTDQYGTSQTTSPSLRKESEEQPQHQHINETRAAAGVKREAPAGSRCICAVLAPASRIRKVCVLAVRAEVVTAVPSSTHQRNRLQPLVAWIDGGLYVFVVYFILHNQLCCPVKASYTVDMNGHTTPGSAFFTHGSGLPAAGGEISKSTQNLISAMEEVPADWERASLQPASQASASFKQSPQNGNVFHPSGGFSNSSLVADEESQEFDDLIFALKTGCCAILHSNCVAV
ncbi:G-protein coupled receptor 98 [Anas platyrhynchos]|uniref:G-protein coupled receptor 98 n=1 Tax=Anas platyrhynchos TaxID=8839 RepID=R0JY16_ANAPL|nr:G-protein coupled receptor 98 [Anas platyrhynchos]